MMVSLGIGIIIAAILMQFYTYYTLRWNVESEAKKLGMVYPTEDKVLDNNQ